MTAVTGLTTETSGPYNRLGMPVNDQAIVGAIRRQEERIASLERGRSPAMASLLPQGLGAGMAIGLIPLGLVVAIRKRKQKTA